MSGTIQDRPQGPVWIAQRLEGDKAKFLRRATEDDVKGQGGGRWSGVGQTEEDVEGQGLRSGWVTDTDEDIQGQGWGYRGLSETEPDVDAEMMIIRLNSPDDVHVDLADRVVQMQPIPPDDVKSEG